MISPNIKGLLVSFSPSSDLFAIASSDGRIKIWDTLKGHLQTEFSEIVSFNGSILHPAPESGNGHLSLDYKCMKWVDLGKKHKKKKANFRLLVLGTGNGDLVTLDVSAGQLKCKISDCHPGGVSAVSFSRYNSCIYTAGVDGMICQIDSSTGSLLSKFRSSTNAISSLSISADGKMLAAASAQLKIFCLLNNKKLQKFSGHPAAVRCMIFSEDGKYILSSAVGEKYIAIWKTDAGKKQSACCVLSVEHPAVFLDSKGSDSEVTEDAGLYVLAVSEMGLCYFWYATNMEELRLSKPTKIALSIEPSISKNNKGLTIFGAKFQGIVTPATGLMLVAYGSLVKPLFEKLTVQYGIDVNLDAPQYGVLLPRGQPYIPRGQASQTKVTALDRANAEDAILPLSKLYGHDKKRKHSTPSLIADNENEIAEPVADSKINNCSTQNKDNLQIVEDITCVEDRLRAAGILGNKDVIPDDNSNAAQGTTLYNCAHLSVDANMPTKKIRGHILSLSHSDAQQLLEALVSTWKTRSANSRQVLTWIYYILVSHGHFIISQESSASILDALQKMTSSRRAAIQPLLKLSGCLRLMMTQIDKAGQNLEQTQSDERHDNASEDEDEDIDELVYGEEEDESQSGSEDDDDDVNKDQP